jgi:hypothetical protein
MSAIGFICIWIAGAFFGAAVTLQVLSRKRRYKRDRSV